MRWSTIAMLLAAIVVLVSESAIVSGFSLLDAAKPSVLRELIDTAFGNAWLAGFLCAIAAAVVVRVIERTHRPTVWVRVLLVDLALLCIATGYGGHARQTAHPGLAVPALAAHFAGAVVWAGGLGVIVIFAVPAWHRIDPPQRPDLVRDLVRRFAIVAASFVVVLIASGVAVTFGELANVSDLWDTSYGRVLTAKIVLVFVALLFAAWHRFVTPGRLENPDTAHVGIRSFETTISSETVALIAALILASVLVALVPGRSLATAASQPNKIVLQVGKNSVEVFLEPASSGANDVHLTFTGPNGLAADDVTQASVTVGPTGATPSAVAMQLIAPGHFAGTAHIPAAGRYRVTVSVPDANGVPAASATSTVSIRGS